ncbi:MAG: GAF domain-containing protein [Chloroflexi bacterium]|nr:MAG: GAF domain-containing protein [Chloroflexota bacterium]
MPATRLVLEERQPRVILATNPDADPAEVALLREQGAVSLLMLPLAAGDRVIGLAKLVNGAERTFTDAEIGLCRALASQAAVAIQNALLFEEVRAGRQRLETLSRQLVELQEIERRHIARELHDEISQVLTGLKLALETIRRLPADMARERLGKAQELVNELMARVRELSLDLRPTMLDDSGLLPALLWHFGHYTAQTGVVVSFEHSGLERRFSAEVETAAYRIVQEALTNVARYAGVNEVAVRVTADEEKLYVEVEDEGVGFDPMSALGAGSTFGLVGMHERAILLGGQLTLDSAPGRGTRLKAELPVGDAINKGDSDAGNNHRAGRRSPDRSRGAAGVVRN